mmetsp:Transcript_8882/g.10372  ORF Transcript_8882/g.10372 Transcript_8882/m.10372 type:complete len:85 (-) Transcript_8882:117-371(-)
MEITAQCIAAVVAVKERLNALEDFKEMRPQFYTLIPHVEYLLTQLQSERQLPPTVSLAWRCKSSFEPDRKYIEKIRVKAENIFW